MKPYTRNCDSCGVAYETRSPTSKYHNPTCKQRARRGSFIPTPSPAPVSVAEATRAELDRVAKTDSALGRTALALAALIDAGEGPPSGLAAVAGQLRTTLESLTKGATPAGDVVDDLAKQRAKRQARVRAGGS